MCARQREMYIVSPIFPVKSSCSVVQTEVCIISDIFLVQISSMYGTDR